MQIDNLKTIHSEEEAFEILRELVETPTGEGFALELDSWPRFVIRIEGKDFNGTIPTRIMPPMLELQKDLNRAYCLLKYGDTNLKRLTKEDREQIELVVYIEKGCSIFEAPLDDILEKLFQSAVDKMTPTQLAIVVIVFGILVTSQLAWKAWLHHRIEQKKLDSDDKRHNQDLEHQIVISKLEKEKMELIKDAMLAVPQSEELAENIDELRDDIVRKLHPKDQLRIIDADKKKTSSPVEITGEEGKSLVKKPRKKAVEKMIKDVFYLRVIDFSKKSKFRAEVERVSDGYAFRADIPLGVLGDKQMEALKNGSWDRRQLHMSVLVKELHGNFTSAKLVSVSVDD